MMGFQRQFDPEIAVEGTLACVNDGAIQDAKSYALAVSTSGSSSMEVAPGLYRVFLGGMSAAITIAIKTGSSSGVAAVLPTTSTSELSGVFPGSMAERIRVLPGSPWVAAISSGGNGTLYLVPLVVL